MHPSIAAIGRQLQADFLPCVAKSLPSELEELIAQLVALEADKRRSAEPSEALQSAVA
jgi:hypothetical protein